MGKVEGGGMERLRDEMKRLGMEDDEERRGQVEERKEEREAKC